MKIVEIEVIVLTSTFLKSNKSNKKFSLKVDSSFAEALKQLSEEISIDLKEKLSKDINILINGKRLDNLENEQLRDGDKIYIVPRIGGG